MFAWFGYPGPMDERLGMIADAGFAATCLWHWAADRAPTVEQWPDWARDRGLRVDNVHSPHSGCNGLWRRDDRGEQIVRRYRETIDYARRHGIPKVVIHITGGPGPKRLGEAGFEQIGELIERAEAAGIVLAIENTRRRDAIDALLERFDTPARRLLLRLVARLPPRPAGRDILRRWGDGWRRRTSPTIGANMTTIFFPAWARATSAPSPPSSPAGYDGPVMLETLAGHGAPGNPAEFLRDAYASAERLAGMMAGRRSGAGEASS